MAGYDAAVAEQFADMAHVQFQQGMARIYDTVKKETGVVGRIFNAEFSPQDELFAQELANNGNIPESEGEILHIPVNINYIGDSTVISDSDEFWVRPSIRDTMMKQYVARVGRTIDRKIITGAFNTAIADNTIAANSAGFTLDKFLEAREIIENFMFDMSSPIFLVMSSTQMSELLKIEQFTSRDYTDFLPWANGAVMKGYDNVYIYTVQNSLLPKTGNDRSIYMYRPEAVCWAENHPMKVTIDRQEERDGTLLHVRVRGGASKIDDRGLVKIQCQES